jgi:hypothetical protein
MRDFDTQRINIPKAPPEYVNAPAVIRKVRIYQDWTCTTVGTGPFTGLFSYTPAYLAFLDQDAADYSQASPGSAFTQRYNYVRLAGPMRVWVSTSPTTNPATSQATVLSVAVSDAFSNSQFSDTPQQGVDWAAIGMKIGINSAAGGRALWVGPQASAFLANVMNVTITTGAPAAGQVMSGTVVIEATLGFK